jgi:hypothetical protein
MRTWLAARRGRAYGPIPNPANKFGGYTGQGTESRMEKFSGLRITHHDLFFGNYEIAICPKSAAKRRIVSHETLRGTGSRRRNGAGTKGQRHKGTKGWEGGRRKGRQCEVFS